MLQIVTCGAEHQYIVRPILQSIGWDEHYIAAFETLPAQFARQPDRMSGYVGFREGEPVGFVFVEHHLWNGLSQIQGLAVHAACQRQGIAAELVHKAEQFAISCRARGVYVDTPITNTGGRRFYEAIGYQLGYIMPRYYENALDGVTYQKFFDA
jgi:ribosomal protein S18 acetylase RimI-like enzyme